MTKTIRYGLIVAAAALASGARAETALQDLAREAGVSEAPLAASWSSAKSAALAESASRVTPVEPRDVFAECEVATLKSFVQFPVDQVLLMTQTCLDGAYAVDPASGSPRRVTAARVDFPGPARAGQPSAGIQIVVEGSPATAGRALLELQYSLRKRRAELQGYRVDLVDRTAQR